MQHTIKHQQHEKTMQHTMKDQQNDTIHATHNLDRRECINSIHISKQQRLAKFIKPMQRTIKYEQQDKTHATHNQTSTTR